MLYALNLNSTSSLPDLLKTAKTDILARLSSKITGLSYANGIFEQFLPSCGCNSVTTNPGLLPELNTNDAGGHNFCYHRPLSGSFLNLYRQTRAFILKAIGKIFEMIAITPLGKKSISVIVTCM